MALGALPAKSGCAAGRRHQQQAFQPRFIELAGVTRLRPGIGKDDISSVSFTIESLSNKAISFSDLFGARLASVGANRQDSRKLVGLCETPTPNPTMPPAAVPEPTTLLLLSAGVLGFAGLRKKFRR